MSARRRRSLLYLLLWLLPAAALAGQAPFLWRIKAPGATHFLLGSVHLLPPETQPFPAAFDQALDQADALLFETDMGSMNDPAVQQRMLAAAAAPQGLQSLISGETYAALGAYLARMQVPGSAFDPFEPWLVAVTLEVLRFQQAGFDPNLGVDATMFRRAQAAGKTIEWFESLEQQIDMLDGLSGPQAEAYLLATISDDLPGSPNPAELLRIWTQSDAAAMNAMVLDMQREYPAIYQRLLAARNARWMRTLEARLSGTQSQLIVVGAAHLVGPDGLLQKLQDLGYEAMPVEDR